MFSWYKYLIVNLVFSHLGFWSGNLFLIAPFPDLCLRVPFYYVAQLLIALEIKRAFFLILKVHRMSEIASDVATLKVKVIRGHFSNSFFFSKPCSKLHAFLPKYVSFK